MGFINEIVIRDIESLKNRLAGLEKRLPFANPLLYNFAKYLAGLLNDDHTLSPSDFIDFVEKALVNLQRGKGEDVLDLRNGAREENGTTEDIAGILDYLETTIPAIADAATHPAFAAKVNELYAQMKSMERKATNF